MRFFGGKNKITLGKLINLFLKDFIYFRERGRERGREGEKH